MQSFFVPDDDQWANLDFLPGVELLSYAQPVPDGSIHRARLQQGTIIPAHTHPADEYVFVLNGTIETGGQICSAGTFWKTPSGTPQGPHIAQTDVEILTIRMGPMGEFEDKSIES
jgi:anti-sigma factor ChrR (cupin superfamily)